MMVLKEYIKSYSFIKQIQIFLKYKKIKTFLKYKNYFIFFCFVYFLWKLRNLTKRRYRNLIRINKDKRYLATSFGNVAYISYSPVGIKPKGLIVLIHGFSGCSENMRRLYKVFVRKGYCIICFDCYGRGCSDATEYPNSPDIFCSMISQGLFALQVRTKVHMVGYSMGAISAGEFCKTFPHLTNTLTLIAPAGIYTNMGFVVKHLSFYPLGETFVNLIGYFLLKKHYRESSGRSYNSNVGNLRKYHCNIKGYFSSLLSSVRHMPWDNYDYSTIIVPKYVIYSDEDEVVQLNSDNLSQLGQITSDKISGASHSGLISTESANRVIDFIENS